MRPKNPTKIFEASCLGMGQINFVRLNLQIQTLKNNRSGHLATRLA